MIGREADVAPIQLALQTLASLGEAAHGRPPQRLDATDVVERILSVAGGIGVTRLADLTGLDFLGLPVWAAYRPNGYVLSLASGKGLSHVTARASALCEAIEHDTAERHLGQIDATVVALEQQYGESAVLPTMGVSRCSFDKVPRDKPLRWSTGINLLTGQQLWVPTELVALDDRKSSRQAFGGWVTGAYDLSSTGLGAGSDLQSAILHGLLELIEEDAMALWRYGALSTAEPAVVPNSFRSETLTKVLDRLAAVGADCRLFDVTASDVGIPAIYAVIGGYPTGSYHDRIFGAGSCCHPSAETAAIRALLEAAQSRIAYISGTRDDLPKSLYENSGGSFPLSDWVMTTDQTKQAPTDVVGAGSAGDARDFLGRIASLLESIGVTKIVVVPIATHQTVEAGIEVVRVITDCLEIDTEGAARQLGRRGLSAFLRAAAGQVA